MVSQITSIDAIGGVASFSMTSIDVIRGQRVNSDSLAHFAMPEDFYFFLLARPKRHASLSPFSESMEVSHSTGRREPLTTC